ncbi:MAG: DUF5711 family protein [Oscillospiraceae bacterium]|jgi:hypothetical protein|nr:DUF5711 family protein [Oscillospiraceae bacterium]
MGVIGGAEAEYDVRSAGKPRAKPARMPSAGAVFSAVLIFAAASAAALAYVVGGELSAAGFSRAWASLAAGGREAVFAFEDGFDDIFADIGDAVVSAGPSGAAVYDGVGEEMYRESFAMANPAIAAAPGGMLAVVYDSGGKSARAAGRSGITVPLTLESEIVSCAVGRGGVFAVTTRGAGEYKGRVEFFRLSGGVPEKIYDWFSGEGPALGAAVSRSGKSFAALTLTARGGRIVLLDSGSTEPRGEYVHRDGAILELAYMASGTLIARADGALIAVSENGEGKVIRDFTGRELDGYACGDAFIVMHLSRADGGGELVSMDERGAELGRIETSRGLVWLSAAGDRAAVLRSDGLSLYDRELRLVASYPDASGASCAFPRGKTGAGAWGEGEGRIFAGSGGLLIKSKKG